MSSSFRTIIDKFIFGSIQFYLLNGISLNFNTIYKFKTSLIIWSSFLHLTFSLLFFKSESSSRIISINHANYSDNMLAYAIRKKVQKKDYLNYSPSQTFFTQGEKHYKRLKKYFKKKNIWVN